MTDQQTQPQQTGSVSTTTVEYLSAGANRHAAGADWSKDGLVAFGTDLNVAFWRPNDKAKKGITTLLSGHTEVVKAVKFLPRTANDGQQTGYLVTGSDDKSVKIWSLKESGDGSNALVSAECIQTTQSHTGPVNCIATLGETSSSQDKRRIFATGAADASVKIWSFDGVQSQVVQTIKLTPKFFPLCLALSELDGALVLAAAGTRDTIQLFVAESSENPEFKHQATLSGHEGWIRSLDFVLDPQVQDGQHDLLLASASQDKYIRLWRFHRGTELPVARTEGNDPSLGAYLPGKSPSNKVHRLKASGVDYSVTFEALLLGHDDWIYSARWFVRHGAAAGEESSNVKKSRLQLLSTSADNTLTIWEADPDSGIWLTTVRLGEISREKGATTATGSTGGFWTGLWSADGNSVTCLGRTGSWRVWNYSESGDQWLPQVGISGHTRAVTGISWAKNGDYLLSTSLDQTTRLHASWKREETDTWHEMSRPQIHGYDLNCIDTLGTVSFVSGADEKLMRVFSEPKAVANLLEGLSGITSQDANALPDAANMPVLGLSNKAIEAVDDDIELDPASTDPHNANRDQLDPATTVRKSHLAPTSASHPPFEDTLSRHTLWPEAEKLYGHGYEISCLAVSHDGTLIASACKASSLNHAVIRLFETERWTEIRPPLAAHTLTATRLRWSADDRHLLSVGRDRAWAVFEREDNTTGKADDNGSGFKLKQMNPKGHTRMILDAAWAPSSSFKDTESGRLVFATAGRDKQVKLWHQSPSVPSTPTDGEESTAASTNGGEIVLAASMKETEPVTAIDFAPRLTSFDDSTSPIFVLAVGTEAGKITIHRLDPVSLSVVSSMAVSPELCLSKSVLQLAWRPQRKEDKKNELAVAGDDGSLRIFSF